MRLRYEPSAATAPWFVPLSLSMPATRSRHGEKVLEPWLTGLLPDRPELLRQWRRQFGLRDDHVFDLLRHLGEDVAGAAQFVRPDRLDAILGGSDDVRPVTDDEIADLLRRAKANVPIVDEGAATGKFSLAGAQAKIALRQTEAGWAAPVGGAPSTHILKPAIPGMDDQDIAELLSMRAAQALGLSVADCAVHAFADERALVVRRFDRLLVGDRWVRVHQEDMCQALGVPPFLKYQSQGGPGPQQLADLVRAHGHDGSGERDVTRFAQAVVYSWLTCGTDAHARNYSMLLAPGQARLAPLYDLNSYLAFERGTAVDMSMSIGRTFRPAAVTRRDWDDFAAVLGIDDGWLQGEVDRMAVALPDILDALRRDESVARFDSPLPARMVANTSAWTATSRRR